MAEENAVTKSELIEALAYKQGHLGYKDVELAVKSLIEQMSDALSAGDRIEIRGFGSFSFVRLVNFPSSLSLGLSYERSLGDGRWSRFSALQHCRQLSYSFFSLPTYLRCKVTLVDCWMQPMLFLATAQCSRGP